MITPEFLLTSLVVVLIPGTGVMYTVSSGLFIGWRAAIAASIGCTLGIVPHLLASIMGLSALLHTSALGFQVLKFAGTAYLLYVAWSMYRETGMLSFEPTVRKQSLIQVVMRAVLVNLLNPKLSIFFLAFLPLFISPQAQSPLLQMGLLSLVFMAMTLGVFVVYGVSASSVRRYVLGTPKLVIGMQRSFAIIFAALGIRLAMAKQ